MIKGLLIYNRKDAERNKWFINELIKEAAFCQIDIKFVYTDELFIKNEEVTVSNTIVNNCDFAIMRDRDYRLSEILEDNGIRVFNSSDISKLGNDKWETYCFYKDKVPMMHTQKSKLPFPFIMKTRSGHGGSEVFLINDNNSYERALEILKRNDVSDDDIIYQMVASDKGMDLRVYVLGTYVMASMLRKSDDDFRANVSLGGKAEYKELSDEEMRIVSKVTECLNEGFFGIDIIYNKEKPLLNEIEDVVGSRMLYEYTDINVAREYILWIKKQLTEK